MLRVAAYCRVSTDHEDQANSFDSQQRYFRVWIQHNPDWELQRIYADEGISGTSTRKRREFHAMIEAALAGDIDLIITKEVSRFARNTLDTLEYTRLLRRHGIGVFFLLDNIDTRNQEGELRLTLMSSMAQEESRKTSERVKWGQTRRMEQGVVFGGSLLGYDVANGAMKVNPQGSQIVRLIFHKCVYEHKGSTVIARELREAEVPSSRGICKWTGSTVLKILKNEKYCGDLIQKKTYTPDYLTHQKKYNRGQEGQIVLRNHHEAIIDRETWEAAQREIARRRRKDTPDHSHGNRYPLSGKIKCGVCQSKFVARKKQTSSGIPYIVWRCGRAAAQGSGAGTLAGCSIGRQLRDEVAMELLRQSLQSVPVEWTQMVEHLVRMILTALQATEKSPLEALAQLEREMECVKEKKQHALEGFLAHDISKADLDFLNQRWDAHIAQLNRTYHTANAYRNPGRISEDGLRTAIHSMLADYDNGEFLGSILDYMTVFEDGRVEVALRLLPTRWIYKVSR